MLKLKENSMSKEFNKEDLVFPFECLETKTKELERIYLEDYGKKYKDIIHNRLDNTIYLLNSTPDFSYEYLKKYNLLSKIDEESFMTEYEDYFALIKDITTRKNQLIFLAICKVFKLNPKDYQNKLEEIITLPFSTFCSNTSHKSSKTNIKILAQENLTTKREEYLTKCANLNIEPITNPVILDQLFKQINIYEQQAKYEILLKSKYINNIKKFIEKALKIDYNVSSLAQIHLFPASCSFFYIPGHDFVRLVFVPLIQIYEEGYSVDEFFLHENRHCVETSIKGIGLEKLNTSFDYHFLNEIRTEKHAIEDLKRMSTIFNKEGINSGYKDYIKFIEDLVNLNSLVFDNSAINNNPEQLETFFTKKGLEQLESFISKLYFDIQSFKNPQINSCLRVDKTYIDEHCQYLEEQALKNGIKIYRKKLRKENARYE